MGGEASLAVGQTAYLRQEHAAGVKARYPPARVIAARGEACARQPGLDDNRLAVEASDRTDRDNTDRQGSAGDQGQPVGGTVVLPKHRPPLSDQAVEDQPGRMPVRAGPACRGQAAPSSARAMAGRWGWPVCVRVCGGRCGSSRVNGSPRCARARCFLESWAVSRPGCERRSPARIPGTRQTAFL